MFLFSNLFCNFHPEMYIYIYIFNSHKFREIKITFPKRNIPVTCMRKIGISEIRTMDKVSE